MGLIINETSSGPELKHTITKTANLNESVEVVSLDVKEGHPVVLSSSANYAPAGPPGPPGPTDWDGITDKPTEFPPGEHQHPVTDLDATGTADETTYLRGDGAWATPESAASPLPYLLPTSKNYQFGSAATHAYTGVTANSIGLLPFIVVAPIALSKIFTSVHTSPTVSTDLELVLYDPDGTLRVNAPVQVSTSTTGKIAAVIDTTLDRAGLWTAGVRFFTEMNGLVLHRASPFPSASLVSPAGNAWDPATAQNTRGLHIRLGSGVSTPASILGMEAQMGPSYAPLMGYEVSR